MKGFCSTEYWSFSSWGWSDSVESYSFITGICKASLGYPWWLFGLRAQWKLCHHHNFQLESYWFTKTLALDFHSWIGDRKTFSSAGSIARTGASSFGYELIDDCCCLKQNCQKPRTFPTIHSQDRIQMHSSSRTFCCYHLKLLPDKDQNSLDSSSKLCPLIFHSATSWWSPGLADFDCETLSSL